MSPCGKILFFLLFLSFAWPSRAALPTSERLPASLGAPLDILSSAPTGFYAVTFGDFKDQLLLTWSGSTLTLIDLETWAEASLEPDSFTASIVDVNLLSDGVTVVVALTSGDVATFDLSDADSFANTDEPSDDEDVEDTDSRQITSSENMDSAGITAMAVSPDTNADTLYLIDESSQAFYELDVSSEDLSSLTFTTDNDFSDDYSPTDIVYADTDGGKLLITTSAGVVLLGSPGDFTFSEITLEVRDDDTDSPDLVKAVVTPDQKFAYILDTTNDAIWVFSFDEADFVDQLSTGTSLDPIEFDTDTENSNLADITFVEDTNTGEVQGYVAGASGVSVIDASDPGTKAETKIIDIDETSADVFDPIALSGSPGQLVSLSSDVKTLLTANGDATLSVLSDNPFITISAVSSDAVTLTESTFTLTFQTDEVGTYTVVADSDPLASTGTELLSSTAVDAADTDTTTAAIDINDFDRSVFSEGDNKVFVFVTDADGNTGWDAAIVNIDRPPDVITINSASFGDQKIFVSFVSSEDDDIATYTIYAEPAADQDNPDCPGDLTFASDGVITGTVNPDGCVAASDCSGTIDGLANAVAYCIAMSATDESDQQSNLGAFTTAITPEATVGPAEFLGQTGCALTRNTHSADTGWLMLATASLFFLWMRRCVPSPLEGEGGRRPGEGEAADDQDRPLSPASRTLSLKGRGERQRHLAQFCIMALLIVFPQNLHAAERTPQNWTLEVRATQWFPTRAEIKPFFEGCCNLTGEVEGGWLPMGNQLNITAGAGLGYNTGAALGVDSGNESGDRFKMLIIPMHLDAVYRFDYVEEQFLAPFVRVGFDSILFHESGAGDNLWANRLGWHVGAGFGLLLDRLESLNSNLEGDMGVNDVYLTFEGRYAQINSFSQTGMDFSGIYVAMGLLFEF